MIVSIKDLREGITEFEQTVTAEKYSFLQGALFPDSLFFKIFIDKIETLFRVKLSLSTRAKGICDRCLEEFPIEFAGDIEQLYQIGHSELDGDEIEILPDDARNIDLTGAIHEMVVLGQPIRTLCREDCKGLCAHCGANLNSEDCGCSTDAIDPRLEKLKTLLK